MRRIVLRPALAVLVPALALVLLAAAPARAETQWVERGQLRADPADPAVLRFTVEIRETASYQVRLLVRGESEREIRFDLQLEPDAGGPARTVHFSFTGRGCG
jgi:hypothetical protein